MIETVNIPEKEVVMNKATIIAGEVEQATLDFVDSLNKPDSIGELLSDEANKVVMRLKVGNGITLSKEEMMRRIRAYLKTQL